MISVCIHDDDEMQSMAVGKNISNKRIPTERIEGRHGSYGSNRRKSHDETMMTYCEIQR